MIDALPVSAARMRAPGAGRKPATPDNRRTWIQACRALLASGERIWLYGQRDLAATLGRTTGYLYRSFTGADDLFRAVLDDYKAERLRAWELAGLDRLTEPYALIDKVSRAAARFEIETAMVRELASRADEPDPIAGARRAAEVIREIDDTTSRQIVRAFGHMGFSPGMAEALALLLSPWFGGSPVGPGEARDHLQVIMEMLSAAIDTGHGGAPAETALPVGHPGRVLEAGPADEPAAGGAAAVKFLPPA